MKNKVIIANFKMNPIGWSELSIYWKKFEKALAGKSFINSDIILCPPFIFLENFTKQMPKTFVLGAQDGFFESNGAYTGAVSLAMLKSLGVKSVILGHSERRKYFCETDEEINQKVCQALKQKITPILCVGETEEERQSGEAFNVLEKTLRRCLAGVSRQQLENLIIAYEPIWAVGTDLIPSVNDILSAKVLIRKVLNEIYGAKQAQVPKIVYGGSVNRKNVQSVCLETDMDGVLVGRPSLEPNELLEIAYQIDQSLK